MSVAPRRYVLGRVLRFRVLSEPVFPSFVFVSDYSSSVVAYLHDVDRFPNIENRMRAALCRFCVAALLSVTHTCDACNSGYSHHWSLCHTRFDDSIG